MRSPSRHKGTLRRRRRPTTNSLKIIVGLFVVILGLATVFTYGPSFTGLVGADLAESSIPVDQTFEGTGSIPVQFADLAQSVKLNGVATGNGVALITLLSGPDRYLIAQVEVNGQQTISNACQDTCSLDLESSSAVLDVEILGDVSVHVDSLTYEYSSTNHPPVWVGRDTRFTINRNQPLTLDLSAYFYDLDEEPLTFVVTADEMFDVSLSNSDLVVIPAPDYVGAGEIVVFVSDLETTVRVPLQLHVDTVSAAQLTSLNAPVEIGSDLIDELDLNYEVDVIVVLKDDPAMNPPLTLSASNYEKEAYINQRRKAIKKQTDSVLSTLNLGEFQGRGFKAMVSTLNSAPVDFRLKGSYGLAPAFTGRITKQGYDKLMRDPRVVRIVKDLPAKLNTNLSVPYSRAAILVNMSLGGIKLNGTGLSACVIDSGIDSNDTAFGPLGQRILNETCFCSISDYGNGGCCLPGNFSSNFENATDDYGHGTLAASIISSANATYPGVAPGANIIAMRTFNGSGDALFSDIGLAIDTCISNATIYNTSVISMSFGTNIIGGLGTTFDASSTGFSNADVCDNLSSSIGTITALLNTAAGLGIIPVASAGNDGFITGISYPACVSNVTSVSAVDNDDSIPDFSNSIALNDAWADGVNICGARGNQSNNLSSSAGSDCDSVDNFIRANGTSFSAPILSGLILTLKQVVLQEGLPNLTVERVRQLLNSSDVFITDSFNGVTRPKVEGLNMVASLARNFTLNVTAATITKVGYGRVNYTAGVNFTNILDCVNISQNYIAVNDSGNCQDFNASAELTFYNVTGIDIARPLRNGLPCPAGYCTNLVQNGNNFTFDVSSFSSYSIGDGIEEIDSCRDLTIPNTIYRLNTSVRANATCFNINESSITLECQGHVIEFGANGSSSVQGVFATGVNNIVVKDCTINDVNESGFEGVGIYYQYVNDSYALNNTIQTNGTDSNYGIFNEQNSDDNLFANNTIRTKGSSSDNYGIYVFTDTTRMVIRNNTIYTNGSIGNYGLVIENNSVNFTANWNIITTDGNETDNYGIYILTGADNGTVYDNFVQTNGTGYDYGIVVESSNNDSLVRNRVYTYGLDTDNYGIYLFESSKHNLLENNTIRTVGTDYNYGVYFERFATDNRVLNNTIMTRANGTDNYGFYAFTGSSRNLISANTLTTNGTLGNYGVVVENLSVMVNLTNNSITTGLTETDNYGVYLLNNPGSAIWVRSNGITTQGTGNGFGVVIENTTAATLDQNRVQTSMSGSDNYGVYLFFSSSNNYVINNTIYADGTTDVSGVRFETLSTNNTIRNNTIVAEGSGMTTSGVFVMDNSTANKLYDNSIRANGSTAHAVFVQGANTSVHNNILAATSNALNCQDGNLSLINSTLNSTGTALVLTSNPAGYACNMSMVSNTWLNGSGATADALWDFSAANTYTDLTLHAGRDAIRQNNQASGSSFTDMNFGSYGSYPINSLQGNNTAFTNLWFEGTNFINLAAGVFGQNFTNTTFNFTDGYIHYGGDIEINGTSGAVNTTVIVVNNNAAFVDSDVNKFLNKSAAILLDNIAYTQALPAVHVDLLDNADTIFCNATRCSNVLLNFTSGQAFFNVTSFTTYSVEENQTSGATVPVVRGGGSGGASRYYYNSIYRQPFNNANAISPPIQPPELVEDLSPPITEQPDIEEPVIQLPPVQESYCGDGLCERGEDSFTCPSDCGVPPPEPVVEEKKTPWTLISALLFMVALLLAVTLMIMRHYSKPPGPSLPLVAPVRKSKKRVKKKK